jgi:hypothetical protein
MQEIRKTPWFIIIQMQNTAFCFEEFECGVQDGLKHVLHVLHRFLSCKGVGAGWGVGVSFKASLSLVVSSHSSPL